MQGEVKSRVEEAGMLAGAGSFDFSREAMQPQPAESCASISQAQQECTPGLLLQRVGVFCANSMPCAAWLSSIKRMRMTGR